MIKPADVSVCMIVKNEQHQIENCLKSIRPYVKEIVIVDTGSTDDSPTICKKYADKFEVFTGCNDADGKITSFSMARQRSFDLASFDWAMWIDGDDEVQNAENLNSVIEENKSRPCLIMFPYDYATDGHGNVVCYHWRERLVNPRDKFHWHGPVHEVLISDAPNTVHVQSEKIKIVHKRDFTGKKSEPLRNLRILKEHYNSVGEKDVRQLYYLGLEYGNAGDLGNAIRFHKRYVELSSWDDEKCLSCLKISDHYQSFGDYENSIQWALKSTTIKENWAEPYFNLAKSYYFMAQRGGPEERRNWEKSIHFAKLGLSFPPTKTILFVNPLERDYEIHKYLNFAMSRVGDLRGAISSAKQGLSARPDDQSLKNNIKVYESNIIRSEIQENLQKLVSNDEISEDTKLAISNLLNKKEDSKETQVEQSSTSNQKVNFDGLKMFLESKKKERENPESTILTFRSESKLDIIVYVGSGPEPWSPETMKRTGIGGSETAVIEMSKRLASFGHNVRVYGDCENLEGIYDGVEYAHFTKFRNLDCDVLISSRRPHAFDDEYNVKSKINICWVHDVGCGSALTHARALRIDKFLCLSKWHRDYFLSIHKNVHPEQVLVTSNGVDLSRFPGTSSKNYRKAVYSSSPDRGMEVAIKIWPEVRIRIPDAELHIFYGFDVWEASARSVNDRGQLDLIDRLKKMLQDNKKNGVFYHGKVDQKRLAEEYESAGVWAYPTWFTETSAISAMEAQAAGLSIITSPIAALNETVGDRGVMIPGDWLSQSYQDKFIDAVVHAMLNPKTEEEQQTLRNYAKENFNWDQVASNWNSMFRNIIEEVSVNVLPPYKSTK